jgi:hypothetical protein
MNFPGRRIPDVIQLKILIEATCLTSACKVRPKIQRRFFKLDPLVTGSLFFFLEKQTDILIEYEQYTFNPKLRR